MSRIYIDEMLDTFSEKELDHVYYILEDLSHQFQFERHLANKDIQIGKLPFEWNPLQIYRKWDEAFAKISDAEKRAIFFDQYRWHVCSYGKISYLEQQTAREAFDKVKKSTILFMYDRDSHIQTFENAAHMTSTDLDSQQDIYLFDESFRWTYIHTHEQFLGPYFIWNDEKAK